jgi:hypothetical protein
MMGESPYWCQVGLRLPCKKFMFIDAMPTTRRKRGSRGNLAQYRPGTYHVTLRSNIFDNPGAWAVRLKVMEMIERCEDSKGYGSEAEADGASEALKHTFKRRIFTPYECAVCSQWHVRSSEDKNYADTAIALIEAGLDRWEKTKAGEKATKRLQVEAQSRLQKAVTKKR